MSLAQLPTVEDIDLVQGDDLSITVKFVDATGAAINLTGWSFTAQCQDRNPVATVTSATGGTVVYRLGKSDTANLFNAWYALVAVTSTGYTYTPLGGYLRGYSRGSLPETIMTSLTSAGVTLNQPTVTVQLLPSVVPVATATTAGVVKPDGTTTTVDADGTLHAIGGGGGGTTSNLPWANITGKPTFANVSISGLYSDLSGLPNLSIYLTSSLASQTYQPLGNYALVSCLSWSNITGKPTFATVSTSGLYSDLSGTPNLSQYQTVSGMASYLPIANFTYANITGKPTLATVAVSGLYSDLSGTPNLSLYLTVASAASTYQTIAGMGNYLTTTAAAAAYYPLTGNPSGFLSSSALTPYQLTATNTFANLSGAPNISLYAPLASPALTGTPTAPTQIAGTNNTTLATTAFVATALGSYQTTAGMASYAPLASPTFTGTPAAPTAIAGTNTTQLATTAFVVTALSSYQTTAGMSSYAPLASPTFTGTPQAPTAANGTNTTQLATTAFVANATASLLSNIPALAINTTGSTSGTFAGAARADHQHVLPTSGVTAGSYGSASTVPAITVDTFGRVTAASSTAIQIDASGIISGTLANARLGVGGTTLTLAASVTWNCNFLQTATLTLGATTPTLTPSGHVAGGTYILILKQDATGSRSILWGSGFKWAGGPTAPTISTAANAVDILTFVSDGTSLYGVAQKAFA